MIKDSLEEIIDELVSKGILWHEVKAQFEKLFIIRVLVEQKGNLNRTSEVMGLHRNTLSKKIRLYLVDARKYRKSP